MQDQPVMCAKFIRVWCRPLQAGFDLVGVFAGGQAGPVGNPENMRIDRDCGLSERLIQNHVRGFAADAGKPHQFLSGLRNLAAKLVQDHLAERDHILGFVAP